ncbi:Rho- GTP-binding protein RhoN [Podila minutissima]|nr:Rho- GTP-binding protein RhoN [Podila minutissima]
MNQACIARSLLTRPWQSRAHSLVQRSTQQPFSVQAYVQQAARRSNSTSVSGTPTRSLNFSARIRSSSLASKNPTIFTSRFFSNQIPRRPQSSDIPSLSTHTSLESTASGEASIPRYIIVRAPTKYQAIVKPILFTAAVSFGAFAAGAYFWEKRQVTLLKRVQAWRAKPKGDRPSISEFIQGQGEIVQEQFSELRERFRWIQQLGIPIEIQKMVFMARQRWMEYTPGERTVWTIIGLNTVVFGAWQVPRWSPFMQKWFMHHPARGKVITLLTSMFSHQHFWHFGLNMFALHSFAVPLHDTMGMEQFLAFYITTGVSASLVSHLFTVSRLAWTQMIPSLGASGALFGCVSSTAYMYPDASVYIIFLPFLPIKIPVALGAMMGLDLVGIIKNWKMFDHYAHLAGSTFGLAYMYGGKSMIWQPMQEKAIEFSKDSSLFARFPSFSPASWNEASKKPSAPPSSSILKDINEHPSHENRTAKEYVQATSDKIKSWWNSKKNGGQ